MTIVRHHATSVDPPSACPGCGASGASGAHRSGCLIRMGLALGAAIDREWFRYRPGHRHRLRPTLWAERVTLGITPYTLGLDRLVVAHRVGESGEVIVTRWPGFKPPARQECDECARARVERDAAALRAVPRRTPDSPPQPWAPLVEAVRVEMVSLRPRLTGRGDRRPALARRDQLVRLAAARLAAATAGLAPDARREARAALLMAVWSVGAARLAGQAFDAAAAALTESRRP